MRHRIVSGRDDWRKCLATGFVVRQAICGDIGRLGGALVSGDCRRVEVWNPANPRGDIAPNLVVEIRAAAVEIDDLGGHGGRLMDAVKELVVIWKKRYVIDDLRIEECE
ncbi:hypothetical protein EG831_02100 [bacterium]|nr:hypothetical protein [bacterium]